MPAPTMQFTLNTTVDLGGANLVPHYTRELQVLHSGLQILVKLLIPIIHLKLRKYRGHYPTNYLKLQNNTRSLTS